MRSITTLISTSIAILALVAAAPVVAQSQGGLPTSSPFSLSSGTERTTEQTAMQFDKADLSFRIMPESQTIEGVAVLDFTATAAISQMMVELDAVFTISDLRVNGVSLAPDEEFRNIGGRVTADLSETLQAGQSVQITIHYSGKPHVAANAPWDGGFVWTETPDGQPWIATAVQGEGCDLFWPCIDHPQGEPARVDLHITVPSTLSAPANGRFVGRTDNGDGTTTWNWTAAHPNTYAVALNVGPYVEMTAPYRSRFGNTVPMHFWRLSSDKPERATALFAEFPRMLDFYESTIGPFPFGDEKMGVVETPHLGMEHQTINAYGNDFKLDGKGYDWLLQHELAHEWFGNQMTNASWDDMWLHEGFGSYMQPLYARWLNGDRYMEAELAAMRLTLKNRFPLVSGGPQDAETVYNDATGPGLDIYYKGALVAHSLRMLIGDEAFFRSLTRLIYGRPDPRPGNFEPRYATTADYVAIVSDEAGRDMSWFFEAYVYQAALPDLVMSREGDTVRLRWTSVPGAFPMPVQVEVDGRLRTFDMTQGLATFEAPPTAHILIDPANKVLRRLDFIDAYQARQAEDHLPPRPNY